MSFTDFKLYTNKIYGKTYIIFNHVKDFNVFTLPSFKMPLSKSCIKGAFPNKIKSNTEDTFVNILHKRDTSKQNKE